ncbi:MAG: lipoyl(octanoyl) transferase LipB [Rhodospirillales bacterium]|nr:lipoyl(octanoyl) transferase LipB [Rhodospirillales bacterium]
MQDAIEWTVSDAAVPYPEAVLRMERRVQDIRAGTAREMIWLLGHPPLYTAGTSAKPEELLAPGRFPVFPTGRGGRYTYHGPGQRVAYVMLDLKPRGGDVRRFVAELEAWLIETLAAFNVKGERRAGQVGIWVDRGRHGGRPGHVDKIAAIGVRVRRWVTYHGISLNVDPDLAHYAGIVPCGIADADHGVTSLLDLGITATLADVDLALMETFPTVFGYPVPDGRAAGRGEANAR